jgi:hypothetical protein
MKRFGAWTAWAKTSNARIGRLSSKTRSNFELTIAGIAIPAAAMGVFTSFSACASGFLRIILKVAAIIFSALRPATLRSYFSLLFGVHRSKTAIFSSHDTF